MTKKLTKLKTIETGTLYRSATLTSHDKEKRTFEISFSSETPVDRWFGSEILSHERGAVDLAWLNGRSAPLLLDHNPTKQVGIVQEAEITADKRGKAIIRFGKSAIADEAYNDAEDGIKTNISVGYQVKRMVLEEDGDNPTYRVVEWKPMEISLVSIPADQSVGIGRKSGDDANITEIVSHQPATDANSRHTSAALPCGDPLLNNTNNRKNNNINNLNTKTMPGKNENKNNEADLNKAKNDAVATERQRSADIYSLASKHGFEKDASSFISEGKSSNEFRSHILDNIQSRNKVVETKQPDAKPLGLNRGKDEALGLSDKEIKDYSFVRAIAAAADKDWSGAGFEKEVSDAVAQKTGIKARGFYVPAEIQQRGLTVGVDVDGGYLKGTDHLGGSFIDMLYNKMVVKDLGATTLNNLVGDIEIPKKTGSTAAQWVGEDEEADESKMAVGNITLSPKTLSANTSFSRKLTLQSDPSVENLVRQDLATSMALGVDYAALNGSGVGNIPQGIMGATGVNILTMGTNGGQIDWKKIVALETAIASNNADLGNLRYVTNTKVRGDLKTIEKANSTGRFLLENNETNGYKVEVSNQIPSNLVKGTSNDCSAMIFGNWADLLIALWGALDILVDPYTEGKKGKINITTFKSADIGLRRAESFAVIKDITTNQ